MLPRAILLAAVERVAINEVLFMTENKGGSSNNIVQKNYRPSTTTPSVRPAGGGVEGNHVPTTDQAPSTPPPNPKKK